MTTSRSVSEEIGIDLEKLRTILRKNLVWILVVFILTNLAAYLVIRWTKPLYESESILRLDMKEDANILGLPNLQENKDNIMAGEIELIRSKLFLNRVIDHVGLDVSYYLAGDVLNDEKFLSSPLYADIRQVDPSLLDRHIFVEVLDENTFRVVLGSESDLADAQVYSYDQLVELPGIEFRLYLTRFFDPDLEYRTFFFVINSREANLNYLQQNLTVEPDKEYAKTIRIAFRDQNATKARVLVKAIDSLYLAYTSLKENQENEQKIAWLNSELRKIESQLEGYESVMNIMSGCADWITSFQT
ncbi:MAG: Wzz/FepE/Etk N-terminal domain-containing protein [Cyclobacteriaceae bacterium]